MFFNQRHEQIVQILSERHQASVHYLAQKLFASEPTIRRDLQHLENAGVIRRTYGGAVSAKFINKEVPFDLRDGENREKKESIALQASRYLHDDAFIFLDASSTVSHLVPYLAKCKNICVLTNGPKTSLLLASQNIPSYCTGGKMLAGSLAYVGAEAERFVGRFNIDVFFFSSRGLTNDGLVTDSSPEESNMRLCVMSHADKKVFLCTDDKIGRKYMYNLIDVAQLDDVVCNETLPEEIARQIGAFSS